MPVMPQPQVGFVNPQPNIPQQIPQQADTQQQQQLQQQPATTLAPFVPGISAVPQANPIPPRRRGAMQ